MQSNPQQTPEWRADRRKKITASRLGDVLAKEGTKRREGYIQEIVWEILDVPDFDDDDKPWFRHGKTWEDEARRLYEWESGNDVRLVGSIQHPDYPFIAASPDGLINDDGGGEIKCRTSLSAHVEAMEKGPKGDYRAQIHGSIWITGRSWWDYISYYKPVANKIGDLQYITVRPDEVFIRRIEKACIAFWDEVQARLTQAKSSIRIR